jgi:hypothetical protein
MRYANGSEPTTSSSGTSVGAGATSGNLSFSSLAPNTSYSIRAKADISGNLSATGSRNISTTAQTAPTINSVSVTESSVTFTVKNNNSVTSTIRRAINANPTTASPGTSLGAGATSGNLSFTGLNSSTTYSVRAASDISGNLSSVTSINMATSSPAPTTNPTVSGIDRGADYVEFGVQNKDSRTATMV